MLIKSEIFLFLDRFSIYFFTFIFSGSDNEENDEMVKQINKKDDDENDSEGEMDEELRQMIDNDVEFDEKDEEKLMDKFYKDLLKEDRENLKKVMQRAYLAGNKRRNADFGIDENDMMKRVNI